MKDNLLNVFFVVDKNYLVPFTVTLTSILENNKNLNLQVFVIHEMEQNEILEKSYSFFKENYNLILNLIKIEDIYFEKFHVSNHITKTTYFKLMLAELIPHEVEKGLYIDCDIVVTGSLEKLNELEFLYHDGSKELSLYAVKDVKETGEIKRINDLGEKINSYFNAGVMFLNLKKWRGEHVAEKMAELGGKYNDKLIYHDQDILNIFFGKNHGNLDSSFNKDASVKHKQMPIVLHYLGLSKPWQFIDNGPYKKCFHYYLSLTPFMNSMSEKITLEKVARKYVRLLKRKMNFNLHQ